MPSFLAYHIGLMSHPGSTFSKNDACPGGVRNFDIFLIFPNCPKKGPGGPGGAIFPLFSFLPPPCGGPYFSFYTAVISPPISPLKAAALWGAPPVHLTLVLHWLQGWAPGIT